MSIFWNDGTSLYHYGIRGQRWGIRRYQNLDGTLTEAGKRRYRKISYAADQAKHYKKYAVGVQKGFQDTYDSRQKAKEIKKEAVNYADKLLKKHPNLKDYGKNGSELIDWATGYFHDKEPDSYHYWSEDTGLTIKELKELESLIAKNYTATKRFSNMSDDELLSQIKKGDKIVKYYDDYINKFSNTKVSNLERLNDEAKDFIGERFEYWMTAGAGKTPKYNR